MPQMDRGRLFLVFLGACTFDFSTFDAVDHGPDGGTLDAATAMDTSVVVEPDGAVKPMMDSSVADTSLPGTDSSTVDLTSGLVAFYKFDETNGVTCSDSSGDNNNATLSEGASFSSGLSNNAASLPGPASYVNMPTAFIGSLTAFSISAWFKLTTVVQWTRIFDIGTGTTSYMTLTPRSDTGTLRFMITVGGNTQEQRMETPSPVAGSWQHVVITLSGKNGSMYLNGSPVTAATISLNPANLGGISQSWLGRTPFSGDPYLNGQLDNFRVYNRALTQTEVAALFSSRL